MSTQKSVVLASGGLNSAVAIAVAAQEGPVALLHARFAHRAAEKEADTFKRQAEHFSVREVITIDLPHFAAIGGNARVSRKLQLEDAHAIGGGEGPSNCNVPGLISALASTGLSWAAAIGATRVYLGVSEDLGPPAPKTRHVLPDYARENLLLLNHMYSVAWPYRTITLEAPLADLNRTEIIKLGRRLQVPFDATWSCISSGTQTCGACLGCATRARGFLNAAMPDPISPAVAAV